jgi:Ni/Co efflux regulator RcnB
MILGTMVLSLAVGSLALADPPQSYDQHHHADEHHRPMDHHGDHHAGWGSARYVRPHGYHAHAWRRGDRLPPAYRSSAYVIPDVAVYHLRPAPRGYYWIRVDGNAVLASMATGAVIDVHVNLFP